MSKAHRAYYTALAADEAYALAVKEIFGSNADRWSIAHRTQMVYPRVRDAYEEKLAADLKLFNSYARL